MDKQGRKDLIREYKETPRTMGVFRVRNTGSGRSIVASSRDVHSVLNRHRAQLRMGGHPDKQLQKEWDALGADAFEFEILDTLEPKEEAGYDPADELSELEALWVEKLAAEGQR